MDEALERAGVAVFAPAADEVEARVGVVESAVRGERLDDVVLGLVRREPADEQPGDRVGPRVGAAPGSTSSVARSSRIGTTVVRGEPGLDQVVSRCSVESAMPSRARAASSRSWPRPHATPCAATGCQPAM